MPIVAMLVTTWLGLAVAGGLVLALVDTEGRRLLLPALPVLGALAISALMHWPALVMGARTGLVVLLGVAVAVVAWRRPRGAALPWRALPVLAAATVAGVPALVVGLQPQFVVDGPRLVSPTSNNDAYAYVTLAAWLADHRALENPRVPPDPPVDSYPDEHLGIGLRIGEEFVHVAAAALNRTPPDESWYTVSSLWPALLPGALAAAACVVGLSAWTGMAAGVLASVAALTIGQLFNQNSASLLGGTISTVTVALVAAALFRSGGWRPPAWLAGLAVTGLLATYSEFVPVLGPGIIAGLAAFALPGGWAVVRHTLGTGLRIGAWAMAAAPLAWFNLARATLYQFRISEVHYVPSPFFETTGWGFVNRYTGVDPTNAGTEPTVAGAVVAIGLAAACLGALWSGPGRRLVPVLGAAVVLVATLTFIRPFPYGQQRAVEITVPIVFLTAAAGAAELIRRAARRHRLLTVVPAAALAAFVAVQPAENIQTSWPVASDAARLEARSIDGAFTEALGWLADAGVGDGEDLMVLDSEFFSHIWMRYLLGDRPQASYGWLFPDYGHTVPEPRLVNSRSWRWALVGTRDYLRADPGVVVAQNDRFRFLDLDRGEAVVALPVTGFYYDEFIPAEDEFHFWMSESGRMVVFRTPGAAHQVTFDVFGLPGLAPFEVTATNSYSGARVLAAEVPAGPGRLTLEVGDALLVDVTLKAGNGARPPPGTSLPGQSLRLTGFDQ